MPGVEKSLTMKELKSKLDENELDLSMCDLTLVPVKELNQLKKATFIDLSQNRLQALTEDFCNLTHLVKLDLSSNRLEFLPHEFGKLVNLEHLDLYKNQLEEFPVSFCRLKKLRWLDVKDNPLIPELRKVAGDCLDAKECQQAAQKVVLYEQKLQADQERDRQKRMQAERESEAKQKAREEEMKQQEQQTKKKEKEKKKQERQKQFQNGSSSTSTTEKSGNRFAERLETKKTDQRRNNAGKKKSITGRMCSCLCSLVKNTFLLVFVVGLVTLGAAGLLYSNCTARPEWIPGSKPLCTDLYQFSATGTPPDWKNVKAAALGSVTAVSERLAHTLHIITHADYAHFLADVQGKVGNYTQTGYKWAEKELGPTARHLSVEAQKGLVWAWNEAIVWTRWTFQRFMEFTEWSIAQGQDFVQNYPKYWDKLKHYWTNMK